MESCLDVRTCLSIVRPELLEDRLRANAPLVVCGRGRGGTSLVSYALVRMGVNMGESLAPNHEDAVMLEALREDREVDAAKAKARLVQMSQTGRYGFKIPDLSKRLDWIERELCKPIFIFVFRNPAATARSIMLRSETWSKNSKTYVEALRSCLESYDALAQFSIASSSPCIFVDVDTAYSRSSDFVSCLADCLDLQFPENLAEKISRPGYRR